MPLFGKIKHTYGRNQKKNSSNRYRKLSDSTEKVHDYKIDKVEIQSPKPKQTSLSETLFSDSIWKDSFDKILDGKTPLRENNLLKHKIRVSFNMDSSVENNSAFNCESSAINSIKIKPNEDKPLNLNINCENNVSTPIGIHKAPWQSFNVSPIPIQNLATIGKNISSFSNSNQESTEYIKIDFINESKKLQNSEYNNSTYSAMNNIGKSNNTSLEKSKCQKHEAFNASKIPNLLPKDNLKKKKLTSNSASNENFSDSTKRIKDKDIPKLVNNINLRRSNRIKDPIFEKPKSITLDIENENTENNFKYVTKRRRATKSKIFPKQSIYIIESSPDVSNTINSSTRKSLFFDNKNKLDNKKTYINGNDGLDTNIFLKPGKWRQSLSIYRRTNNIKIHPVMIETLEQNVFDNKFNNLKHNRRSCRIIAAAVNEDNEKENIDCLVKKLNLSLAKSLVLEPTDDEVYNLSSTSFSLCDESATTAIRKTRSAKTSQVNNISSYSTTGQGNRICEIVDLCTKFNDSDIFQRSLSLGVSDQTRELSIKEIIVSRARSSTNCSALQQQSKGESGGENNCTTDKQLQLYKKKQSLFKNRKASFIESPTTPIRLVNFGDLCFNKEHLIDLVPKLSTREIVLRRCGQAEPIDFNDIYSESALRQCRKIGEGVYGEVFMNKTQSGKAVVLKIIPIEGNIEINGESQKKFDEILSEIIIAMELSSLRNEKNNNFMTSGFVEVVQVRCVQGRYPEHLIDLWELYRDNCGTENDHPEIFPDNQLYIVLELANAGQDLEAFNFTNALQSYSAFVQTALTLAVAEEQFQFEHRDLHWGNILISTTDDANAIYKLNGNVIKIPTHGVKVTIIDYTLSRMIFDGCCLYNDLSNDNELFSASGDYQFDIYRFMKDRLDNSWESYEPYTNILWLHYTIDKMINGARYRNTKSKKHRTAIHDMMQLRDELLDFKSASDYVKNI